MGLLKKLITLNQELKNLRISLSSTISLIADAICVDRSDRIAVSNKVTIDCYHRIIEYYHDYKYRTYSFYNEISIDIIEEILRPENFNKLLQMLDKRPILSTIKFLLEENLKTIKKLLNEE